MPPVTDFVLRTELSAAEVERQLRSRLGAGEAGAERYWIQVRPVNAEQRADSARDFGLEPTLTGALQPRRGESQAAIESALLDVAHAAGAELVVFYVDLVLLAYRGGVVHPLPEER